MVKLLTSIIAVILLCNMAQCADMDGKFVQYVQIALTRKLQHIKVETTDVVYHRPESEINIMFLSLIRIYQLCISSQDKSPCIFTPSCSRYGMAALRKHGPVRGLLMTSDRLQRCSILSTKYYQVDSATSRCFDPVR